MLPKEDCLIEHLQIGMVSWSWVYHGVVVGLSWACSTPR